uniref:Protein ovary overexpressed n=1 Tax=Rhipicephalus microplus TaxID=6941 RepID=A0A6M2CTC5_RHIMP
MEGQLNVDDLESQQYAKLLALARELGYTCKGNPKKAKVVKFIRQSVACGLVKGKENSSVTFAPDTTAAESSPEFVQPVDVAPPKRAVAANRTPGPKSASKVKKTPNFSKLHAAEFDKMKSVVDCAARRNILASSAGRTPQSAARLNNIPHPDTSQTPKAASRIPRLIVNKAKTVPLREPVRARISPSQRTATRQRQVRTILGKVRSNRRFDLLMAKRGFVCD